MDTRSSLFLFVKRGIILLLILLLLDRVTGMGLERIFYMQKHGDNFVSIYLLEKAKEDILILGGSRASHHFNATTIEDSTHMTCFNGGRDEMNVLYSAATLPLVYKKYSPKIIILEMLPTELWLTSKTEESYDAIEEVLLPFAHKYPSLLPTISLAGNMEVLKTKVSYIYPYNSTIGTSVQNAFSNMGHISVKGYEPLNGIIDTATYKKPIWEDFAIGEHPLNTYNVAALNKIIKLAKDHNTRFITIISPFYFPVNFQNISSYREMQRILKENNCELYDFSHDERFLKNPYLFYDDVHLNDSGATIFDRTIIDIIKNQKR